VKFKIFELVRRWRCYLANRSWRQVLRHVRLRLVSPKFRVTPDLTQIAAST